MSDTPPVCTCSCHNGGRFATCSIPEGCAHLHPHGSTASAVLAVLVEADLSRPSSACLLCPPPGPSRKAWTPADRGYRTCSDCYDRVREHLADIRSRYAALDATPGASLEHGSRGAPGFGSRPSASLHIVAMRDWRSKTCEVSHDDVAYIWDPLADTVLEPGQLGPPGGAYTERREVWRGQDGRAHSEQSNPVRSIPLALAGWADVIACERDMEPPTSRDVAELVRWIDGHMDWLTRHDLVVEVDGDLRKLIGQLRPVTGDPGRRAIGMCPNTIDAGTVSRECGAKLYAPLKGDSIDCGACGRVWPRAEWLKLGDLLESA